MGGGALAVASSIGSSVADSAVQAVSGTSISDHIVNTASAITSTSANSPTPLVPSANPAATIASMEASTPKSAATPTFFPFDKNPAVTAAHYHRAQILDTADKDLLAMTSLKS
jgi:hypothetical protein